jgi:hypothetical protein
VPSAFENADVNAEHARLKKLGVEITALAD